MGLSSALCKRDIRYREVTTACGVVRVRGLSEAESLAVHLAFERPEPPLRKNPSKGSLAEPEPDFADAAYIREAKKSIRDQYSAETAVAVELELDGERFPSDADKQTTWLRRSTAWMQETFSEAEIESLWSAARALAGFEAIKAQAQTLIVSYKPSEEPEERDPLELPKDWTLSEEGLLMRAAARFGQDPATWPQTLSAADRAKVIADQILLGREQAATQGILKVLAARLAL